MFEYCKSNTNADETQRFWDSVQRLQRLVERF